MLGAKSHTNQWGCMACYNLQKKNGAAYCSMAHQRTDILKTCPLGLDTAFVDSLA